MQPGEPRALMQTYTAMQAYMPDEMRRVVAGRRRQLQNAYAEAAENLVAKAWKAWQDDRPRALVYLGRALQLPYDAEEQALPPARAGHLWLFNLVADMLEASAEDDPAWLEAALAAYGRADERGRFELAAVLHVIDADFDVAADERRRLRAVVGAPPSLPANQWPDVSTLGLEPDALQEWLASILDTGQLYLEALEALG